MAFMFFWGSYGIKQRDTGSAQAELHPSCQFWQSCVRSGEGERKAREGKGDYAL